MMIWRIEVSEKKGFYDAAGASVERDIRDLGISAGKVKEVRTVGVYLIEGDASERDIRKVCDNLVIDPVTQDYTFS